MPHPFGEYEAVAHTLLEQQCSKCGVPSCSCTLMFIATSPARVSFVYIYIYIYIPSQDYPGQRFWRTKQHTTVDQRARFWGHWDVLSVGCNLVKTSGQLSLQNWPEVRHCSDLDLATNLLVSSWKNIPSHCILYCSRAVRKAWWTSTTRCSKCGDHQHTASQSVTFCMSYCIPCSTRKEEVYI